MFYYCVELKSLDLSNFNLDNVISTQSMFKSCSSLKEIKFNDNTLTKNLENMNSMFDFCKSLKYINTKIFNQNKVKYLRFAFSDSAIKELNLPVFEYIEELSYTFSGCFELEKIDISHLNTSKVQSFEGLFDYCEKLTSIDISMLNTRNLVVGSKLFNHCNSLISLDLSSFDLRSLAILDFMFSSCKSLKYVALPDHMPSINSTEGMFNRCNNLKSINLNFLQFASKLEKASNMFSYCISLTEIVFPKLEANKLLSTNEMFLECTNLKSINLEGIKTKSIQVMISMFENCVNLEYLNIKNIDTRYVTYFTNIFNGVKKGVNVTYTHMITDNTIERKIKEILKAQS